MGLVFNANGINNDVIPKLKTSKTNLNSSKTKLSSIDIPTNFNYYSKLNNMPEDIEAIRTQIQNLIDWLNTKIDSFSSLEKKNFSNNLVFNNTTSFSNSIFTTNKKLVTTTVKPINYTEKNTGAKVSSSSKSVFTSIEFWASKKWEDLKSNTGATIWKDVKSALASIANLFVAFAKGLAQFVETLIDLLDIIGTGILTIGTAIGDIIVGNDWATTKEMWKETMAFVAKDHVGSEAEKFYKTTPAGQWLDNNAYSPFKSDGIACKISSGLGYVVGLIALTVVTAGTGTAVAGASTAVSASTVITSSAIVGLTTFSSVTAATWADMKDKSWAGVEESYKNGEVDQETYNSFKQIHDMSDEEWSKIEESYKNGEISEEDYNSIKSIREMPDEWQTTENIKEGLKKGGWEGTKAAAITMATMGIGSKLSGLVTSKLPALVSKLPNGTQLVTSKLISNVVEETSEAGVQFGSELVSTKSGSKAFENVGGKWGIALDLGLGILLDVDLPGKKAVGDINLKTADVDLPGKKAVGDINLKTAENNIKNTPIDLLKGKEGFINLAEFKNIFKKEKQVSGMIFENDTQIKNYLGKINKGFIDKLTEDEIQSIKYYCGPLHEDINNVYLRKTITKSNIPPDSILEREINNIDNAINKYGALEDSITVFRGVGPNTFNIDLRDPNLFKKLKKLEGTNFSDKGFISTSLIKDEVNQYASPILMEINVPKGNYGVYVKDMSFYDMNEFLLRRDLDYCINDVIKDNGKIIMKIDVVDINGKFALNKDLVQTNVSQTSNPIINFLKGKEGFINPSALKNIFKKGAKTEVDVNNSDLITDLKNSVETGQLKFNTEDWLWQKGFNLKIHETSTDLDVAMEFGDENLYYLAILEKNGYQNLDFGEGTAFDSTKLKDAARPCLTSQDLENIKQIKNISKKSNLTDNQRATFFQFQREGGHEIIAYMKGLKGGEVYRYDNGNPVYFRPSWENISNLEDQINGAYKNIGNKRIKMGNETFIDTMNIVLNENSNNSALVGVSYYNSLNHDYNTDEIFDAINKYGSTSKEVSDLLNAAKGVDISSPSFTSITIPPTKSTTYSNNMVKVISYVLPSGGAYSDGISKWYKMGEFTLKPNCRKITTDAYIDPITKQIVFEVVCIPNAEAGIKYSNIMSPVKKGISIEDLNNEIKNNPNGVELKINSAIDEMHAKKIYDGNQSMKYHGYDHVENVTKYTMYIADKKNLSIDEQEMLKDCAIYHDAGLVQSVSEKYPSNNHGISGSAYAVDSLMYKYNQQQLNKIGAIIEAHEASDRMLGPICSKYGIYDIDEIKKVNEMLFILKDADALDRARFPGNLDINHLRNDESKDLVKAAFENVEIKSSNKLKELLNSKTLSKNEYSEVSMLMKSGKYPDHIVLFALENYKNPTIQNSTNIHSITEYANYILNNKKFS